MEDMVLVMLGRLRGEEDHIPCFVWSGQECEPVECWDVGTFAGGKSLERFYKRWPCWNASNTIIIDYNFGCMACNPRSNIIILCSFYVEQLKKLADDKNYLKSRLWPMLQGLFDAANVQEFNREFPHSVDIPDTTIVENCKEISASQSHNRLQGRGTHGPQFILSSCLLTLHL